MPAAVNRVLARVPLELTLPAPAYLAALSAAFLSLVLGGASITAAAPVHEAMYPQVQGPVTIIDASGYTVAQLIEKLPITERFSLLLSNTGVLSEIEGQGPYTILAPANNYFDYLPQETYVSATRSQQKMLAERHVISGQVIPIAAPSDATYLALSDELIEVQTPGDGSAAVGSGFIMRAYKAKNGLVYVINNVLLR